MNLLNFSDIAKKIIEAKGYQPLECHSEEEARSKMSLVDEKKMWPCYFFRSDTTGEKPFEEFFTSDEKIITERYKEIGIIKGQTTGFDLIKNFINKIVVLKNNGFWTKQDLVDLFKATLPDLDYHDLKRYLDQRM